MKRRGSLHIDRWPNDHREAFVKATDKDEPLEVALGKNWKDSTRRGPRLAWGMWLDFRIRHDLRIDCSPDETLTSHDLVAFIVELKKEVASTTAASYVRDIGQALRVMNNSEEGQSLRLVQLAAQDLDRAAERAVDNITPQVAFRDVYASAKAQLETKRPTATKNWRDALDYLDALMILIDLVSAARLRTLNDTKMVNFKRRGSFYRLTYLPHQLKSKKKLISSMPPDLTADIETGFKAAKWLAEERGIEQLSHVFVSRWGTRMKSGWMSKRIRRATANLVEVPLSPQRLRRLRATSIHSFAPHKLVWVSKALQHHAVTFTRKYYVNGTGGVAKSYYLLRQEKLVTGGRSSKLDRLCD